MYVVTPGPTNVVGPSLRVDACPVVDGAYVLGDANIRIDARGEASGHCNFQLLSGSPPICTVVNGGGNGDDKTVNSIAVRYYKPANSTEFTLGKIDGKNPATGQTPYFMQVVDSTDTAASTGPKWYIPGLGNPGEHRIAVWTLANTTICNIQPATSPTSSSRINAVSCLPRFNLTFDPSGDPVIAHVQEGAEKIKIYPPEGKLRIAAEAAASAWSAGLKARGINIDFETAACAASDPRCIRVSEESPGADNCAGAVIPGVTPEGYPSASPLLRIASSGWDQDYLNFLLTHELGHLFGLNNSTCPVDRSVMWGGHSNCGEFPAAPPTPSTVPTPSDFVAAATTGYRNGTTATCPATF
jgi:hypothetical protein